jgi:uncharacterized protein YndB with AHSA1/START domain
VTDKIRRSDKETRDGKHNGSETDKRGEMGVITESVEISRRPEEVFPYVADPSHFPEWEEQVISASREGDAPFAVGSRVSVTRRVGPRKLPTTEEIVELSPPKTWTVRGVAGIPVIAIARGRIEPLDRGERSRVTIELEFEGHGIGKLLLPLVIYRQARRQLPRDLRSLKARLENAY